MGIFDNATSIVINDKEVKSISVDGGVIYEADEPTPSSAQVVFYVTNDTDESYDRIEIDGAEIIVDGDSSLKGVTVAGFCPMTLLEGTHTFSVTAEGYETYQGTFTLEGKTDVRVKMIVAEATTQ